MKKILLITILIIFTLTTLPAQSVSLEWYVGTWVYSDPSIGEEFTVKLRKVQYEKPVTFGGGFAECLVGVYRYKKDNQTLIDNLNKLYNNTDPILYPIWVLSSTDGLNTKLGLCVVDYTLSNSKGEYKSIGLSSLEFNTLSPATIKWTLVVTEQEYIFTPIEERFPRGTNLPTEMILTKVE